MYKCILSGQRERKNTNKNNQNRNVNVKVQKHNSKYIIKVKETYDGL